ncbi:hypothetical protein PFICI_02429 [Pestalotiopsis fici W106-1]|uniref:Uncharacterized protein n=1 Tax=Pestalotiopsis fici (strain W106-1 / CGMCC3.15140) TaxID=1229662 RepID=W3XEF9_PESFW|nr:uncharacterized protein PFICI_02429 [Pestalotiopsis fici W106-1]ETS84404.1 hypothetical protein PFICI_02429 [Pestalotiopsis fici W106-1]
METPSINGRMLEDIEDEDQSLPRKRRTRRSGALPKKLPAPLYKATVKELADKVRTKSSSTANIDKAITERIKKCLERANHPNTPEAEAKTALHLASRWMAQNNVTQAELLAHEAPEQQKQYAGQSIVAIIRLDGDKYKSVRQQSYVGALMSAMNTFFDCKSYTTMGRSSLHLTFYGIAENTVAAAMAFEMVYNSIAEWARPYKGVASKNSYAHGFCNELLRLAVKEKNDEMMQARKAESDATAARAREEENERLRQLSRLAPGREDRTGALSDSEPPTVKAEHGDTTDESDDERDCSEVKLPTTEADTDSDDFLEPDFDDTDEKPLGAFDDLEVEIKKSVKIERSPSVVFLGEKCVAPDFVSPGKTKDGILETDDAEPESKWASHSQLVTFRKTALQIADDYLQDQDLKLRKKSAQTSIKDRAAYNQGKEDSKKVDVHRKRITEGKEWQDQSSLAG